MSTELDILAIALVFAGAALFAALALFAKQSLIVAYIALGALLGPWGLGFVSNTHTIAEIGHVGIVFLLFLLGLNLHPQKLLKLMGEVTLVTFASSAAFAAIGLGVAFAFGFGLLESAVVGVTMAFSSTIIALKLIPTTALHHRRMGEVVISVLLLQDIIAIVILLFIQGIGTKGPTWIAMAPLVLYLPALAALALLVERYVLIPLIRRFDTIQEYIFVTAIGWCLGVAQLAQWLGLSYEIGAFIAGVALAANPIALFIAESLKPLRDFFLIMFFFSLGASFALPELSAVALPALALAAVMLVAKPFAFKWLLASAGEPPEFAWEVGVRLGQASEFALMIAVLAVNAKVIGEQASYLIQAATLLTFIVSAYVVMLRFPTPIAVSASLRRN